MCLNETRHKMHFQKGEGRRIFQEKDKWESFKIQKKAIFNVYIVCIVKEYWSPYVPLTIQEINEHFIVKIWKYPSLTKTLLYNVVYLFWGPVDQSIWLILLLQGLRKTISCLQEKSGASCCLWPIWRHFYYS